MNAATAEDVGDLYSPHANYLAVFGVLCGLTALSVAFDFLPGLPTAARAALVLGVAAAKAACVLAYFMHLKFEGAWKYVVLAPTALLGVGLVLALWPDIAVHYYAVENDPTDATTALVENEDGPGLRTGSGAAVGAGESVEPYPLDGRTGDGAADGGAAGGGAGE